MIDFFFKFRMCFEWFHTTYPGLPPHNFIEEHMATYAQNCGFQLLMKNLFLFALFFFFHLPSDLALNWNTLVSNFTKHSLNNLNNILGTVKKTSHQQMDLVRKDAVMNSDHRVRKILRGLSFESRVSNSFKWQLLPWVEGLIFNYKEEDRLRPIVLNLILTKMNWRYWVRSLWINSSILPESIHLVCTPWFSWQASHSVYHSGFEKLGSHMFMDGKTRWLDWVPCWSIYSSHLTAVWQGPWTSHSVFQALPGACCCVHSAKR